jgi:tRNA (guanosine-2'-O-)-methyltransferase
MGGGGPRYEKAALLPPAEDLLVDGRKERIEQVLAGRTRTLTVVLDRLEDTFNMAAVLRTCEGLGIQDVHVVENPKVPFHPNGKVTQGCDKWLDLHVHKDFAACRAALTAQGFSLYASAIRDDSQSLYSLRFDSKVALIFGNERVGVSAEVLAGVDGCFWIPMRGFTRSFNISVAASAALTRAVAWRDEHLGSVGDLTDEQKAELRERFQFLAVKQRHRIYGDNSP